MRSDSVIVKLNPHVFSIDQLIKKHLYFVKRRNDILLMMELTRVFKALSDSNRIRIIEMISEKPLCVCEITAVLDLATSTVSKHLSILKDAGLILDEKDGKWVNYRLNETDGNDQIRHLIFLVKSWLRDSELILRDKVQLKSVDRNHICKGSS